MLSFLNTAAISCKIQRVGICLITLRILYVEDNSINVYAKYSVQHTPLNLCKKLLYQHFFVLILSWHLLVVSLVEEKSNSRPLPRFSILSPGRSQYRSPYQITVEPASLGTQAYQTDPFVLVSRTQAFIQLIVY